MVDAVAAGDCLVALPSSGLHTNGYSLARKIAFERLGLSVESHVAELGETVGAALLRPHRTYLRAVEPLLEAGWIKGMAHITGGGIPENLPRTLPDGRGFRIDDRSWTVPPVFRWLQRRRRRRRRRDVPRLQHGRRADSRRAPRPTPTTLLGRLRAAGERPWILGHVT